jgi:DNA-binding CsgD family transcriptional regulator/PAS domain-containing protein
VDEGSLVEVIDRIYAAVGKPEDWPGVLQNIVGVTGARSGCILATFRPDGRGNVSSFHEIDPDWIRQYNEQFYLYDSSPALLEDNPGRVIVDAITGPRPTNLTGENRLFYNEVMRPQSFRHTLHAGLFDGGQRNLGIILQRPPHPGPFETDQIAALQKLTPHLHRALTLHARFQAIDCMASGLSALLDHVPMGVILLDAFGDIVHANSRAEQVLGHGLLLRNDARRLTTAGTRNNESLQRLIAAALNKSSLSNDMTLHLRARGPHGLYVQVTPMETKERPDPLLPAGVRAAVWIGTYEPSQLSPVSLAHLYSLSPSEAELLARLVEGKNLSEIADLRQVSIYTARTQLKTIMSKLNISRQVDLVRLVMSGPCVMCPD